jgi:hypothetical protein
MKGTTTAKIRAAPRLRQIWRLIPEWESANPPFKPRAIKRYKDRKREIAGGISKLDLAAPARTPKIKNRMAGSRRFCIF